MGGAVCALASMYVSSGCRASVVASTLAFLPPDPFYELTFNPESEKYSVSFLANVPVVDTSHLEATLLLTSTGGRVPVFYFACPDATETILLSHGNASDCGSMFMMYWLLATALRVNVVGYDYTGFGASKAFPHRPTEEQTYVDILAVYDWCLERKIVVDPSRQLVLYGQSVGSGPSTWLAVKKPVAGLILHSPILSGLRVITDSRLFACFDIFPNLSRIPEVRCPVFVMHGEDDEEVPLHHGVDLHGAVPEKFQFPAWWVPQRGHNDMLYNNEVEFIDRVEAFLRHVRSGVPLDKAVAGESGPVRSIRGPASAVAPYAVVPSDP